jgi:hypothetical protein
VITREQASPQARALVEELRDVMRNEVAWEIAERYLAAARGEALERLEKWAGSTIPPA